jgi:hypothetical protein
MDRVKFNGHNGKGSVIIQVYRDGAERPYKSGWLDIGEGPLFKSLSREWPPGAAVGIHDVTGSVTVEGDTAVIDGSRYPIRW